jgi:hypothetical protein
MSESREGMYAVCSEGLMKEDCSLFPKFDLQFWGQELTGSNLRGQCRFQILLRELYESYLRGLLFIPE